MDYVLKTLGALWQIIVFGILIGAGLPALFALGLRALSPKAALAPVPSSGATVPLAQVSVPRKLVAGLCFAVVVAAVITGIVFLVATGHR